jgi:cysteine rich repeat protein
MSKRLLVVAILLVLPASVALAQNPKAEAKAILEACKPDIAHFCGNVPPGEGRVKACMKSHLPELSEPCKEALFQAWLKQ